MLSVETIFIFGKLVRIYIIPQIKLAPIWTAAWLSRGKPGLEAVAMEASPTLRARQRLLLGETLLTTCTIGFVWA